MCSLYTVPLNDCCLFVATTRQSGISTMRLRNTVSTGSTGATYSVSLQQSAPLAVFFGNIFHVLFLLFYYHLLTNLVCVVCG